MLAEGIPVKVKRYPENGSGKKRIGHTLERIGIGFLIAGLVPVIFPERMGEPLEQAMKAGSFYPGASRRERRRGRGSLGSKGRQKRRGKAEAPYGAF